MNRSRHKRINFKIKKLNQPQSKKLLEKPTALRKREMPVLIIATFSVIGILLYLIGYGVALSAEDTFRTPYSSLFSSSLELVELSVWAIVIFIDKTISLFKPGDLFVIALYKTWSMPAIMIFLWGIVVVCIKVARMNLRPVAKIKTMTKRRWRQFYASYHWVILLIKGIVPITGAWILGCAVLAFFTTVIIILCFFLMSIPTAGLNAGSKYLYDYVVNPKSCAPVSNRVERIKAWEAKQKNSGKSKTPSEIYATCLRIRSNKSPDPKEYGSGRLVFSTSSAVILFDPNTGAAWRVSTKDAVIEVIDKLK